MPDTSIKTTLDFLYSLHSRGIKLGLKNITEFLERIGNPQRAFSAIHISGTNGKGSVANMIASALTHAGYRVGLYTSPHILEFNERIRVNRKKISNSAILSFARKYWPYISKRKITFFEVTTAMAFDFFRKKRVDIAVLETGMGGRLDATRLCRPILTVITHIGLDHEDYLGKTLASIATEKLGIIKKGIPLVAGHVPVQAKRVIKKECKSKKVPLFMTDELKYRISGNQVAYRIHNRNTAIFSLMILKSLGIKVPRPSLVYGLKQNLPGRFMAVSAKPMIIIEVAHNADGFSALNQELKVRTKGAPVIFVLGIMKDKSIGKMVKQIISTKHTYILTRPPVQRAASQESMACFFGARHKFIIIDSIKDAVDTAVLLAGSKGIVCICGSFYTVEAAVRILDIKIH
jgi:dihydrofolate synthase/folylpolyglutamate synthase